MRRVSLSMKMLTAVNDFLNLCSSVFNIANLDAVLSGGSLRPLAKYFKYGSLERVRL